MPAPQSRRFFGVVLISAIFALGILAAGRLVLAAITQTATFGATVQAPIAKQLHYRWRNDDGGEQAAALSWATTSNPGTTDGAYGLAVDSSSIYVVGYKDGNSGYFEKRNKSNGALIYATTSDFSTAEGRDIAIDSQYMYIASADLTGDGQWWIEKLALSNGAFIAEASTSPGNADDEPSSIVVDGTFMYVVGNTGNGQADWYMEKRNLSDLAPVWVTSSNPGAWDFVGDGAIDDTYLYVVGGEDLTDGRIEKRLLSSGALVFATTSDLSGNFINGIAIDSQYMYLAVDLSASGWWIQKRNLSNGALVYETSSNSGAGNSPQNISIDKSYMYVVGSVGGGLNWGYEKRRLSDGGLVYSTSSNPGVTDMPQDIAIDGQNMYAVGDLSSSTNWYLESRTLGHDTSTATFSTAEDNPLLNLGVGTLARLRMMVQNAGDAVATSSLYRLEYSTSTSGPWTRVGSPASTSVDWITSASAYLSSTQGTHNITGLTDPTSTVSAWYSGEFKSTSSQATLTSTLNPSQFTEYEYAVKGTGSSTLGIPYYFRLTNQGTSLDTYSIYASATLATAPISLTAITVNSGNAIILTPNATTSVSVSWTVSGGNGCGSVFYGASSSITSTLYRSGVSSTCANTPTQSTLNCYYTATTTNNCTSNTSTASANATTTFQVWYFAESTANTTTASSSYAGQDWRAFVGVKNGSGTTSTAVSASGVGLEALLAITAGTSTNYGTVFPNTNTSGTNQTVPVKNAGNVSTTLQLSGTAMCQGGTCMATSSQHYATSTFTYGGAEQQLQSAATAISGWVVQKAPGGMWSSTTDYPSLASGLDAVMNGNQVIVIGGYDEVVATTTINKATIAANGTLGSWSTSTPLPSGRTEHRALLWNGYIYAFGGVVWPSALTTSSVVFASVNASGTIGAWATTTPFPYVRQDFGIARNNSYVYIVGGQTLNGTYCNDSATSSVLFALMNTTGSISAWSSTTPLPYAGCMLSAAVHNGYLYVGPGMYNTFDTTSTVFAAPLNSTGSIGSWTAIGSSLTGPGVTGLGNYSMGIDQGILYLQGGIIGGGGSDFMPYVQFAILNGTSSFGSTSLAPSLPNESAFAANVMYNGYSYVIAGYSAGPTTEQTVYYAPLSSRNLYWGLGVPGGTPQGNYQGVNTYVAVYSP